MRLLVLVTDAYGGRGGIAQFNRDLLSAMATHPACGEIVVVPRTMTDPPGDIPARVTLRAAGARGKLAFVLDAHAAMREGIDGVVCGHLNLAPLAAYVAWRQTVPWLVVTHGIEAWPRRGVVGRHAVSRADRVVAVSEYTRRRFTEWAPVSPDRILVIPNSVDTRRFTPGPKSRRLVERYRLDGASVMMTLGRLAATERYKGVEEVLRVMPELTKAVPSIVYLIVGEGDDRPRLEALARSLGIESQTRFTGYISEEEKVDHYRLADAFVMPGRGEGFGIAYLEAMACGVGVVASTRDASAEVVWNDRCGVLADPDDPNDVRRAILSILRSSVRPAATEVARFDVAAFTQRWHRVLTDVFLEPMPGMRRTA